MKFVTGDIVDLEIHGAQRFSIVDHHAIHMGEIEFLPEEFHVPKIVVEVFVTYEIPAPLVAAVQESVIPADVDLVFADATDARKRTVRRAVELVPPLAIEMNNDPLFPDRVQ